MSSLRVRNRCLAAEIACLFPWDSARHMLKDNPGCLEPFPVGTLLRVRNGQEPAKNTDTEDNRASQQLATAKRTLLQACRTAGLARDATPPVFLQTEQRLIELAKDGKLQEMQQALDDSTARLARAQQDGDDGSEDEAGSEGGSEAGSEASTGSAWSGKHCPGCGAKLPRKIKM